MSERNKVMMMLAKKNKVVCVQEAGDLQSHLNELTQDNNKEAENCDSLEPQVFTEMEPLLQYYSVDSGEGLYERNVSTNNVFRERPKNNDNIQVFQEYEEDNILPEDDLDLDPNYDPEEPDGISEKEKKTRRLAKHFGTDTYLDMAQENNSIEVNRTEDVNQGINIEQAVADVNVKENKHPRAKKRARTKREQVDRHLEKYKVLSPCKCNKKCGDTLTDERRQQICESYWKMGFGERRQHLSALIKIGDIKRRKVDSNNKRQCVLTYSLIDDNGLEKKVCKRMFLNTLGMKTDGMITEFKRRHENTKGLDLVTDKRGSSVPPNKKDSLKIINHIESYKPQISHYKLEHAPNRRYLPHDIYITEMWKNYCENHEKISYDRYRFEFNSQNIGFDQPNQDECDVCARQKEHTKVCSAPDECDQCVCFNKHHENYINARKAYDSDRDQEYPNTVRIFSADMQKVLLLPKLSLKSSVFVSKLVVFNETFASLTKDEENICVLWHEGISGRSAEDVASAYCAIIQRASVEVKEYLFWCDNCSAQNKNWKLFSSFVIMVNSNWGPNSITLKYFEPGHSYMKADSVHGNIGKFWKRKSNIYDLNELNELILKSSRKNKTLLMRHDDFYNFKDGAKQRKKNYDTFPKLNTIQVVQFQKGSRLMFYKKSHSNTEFLTTDFLKPKFVIENMPESKNQDRGVNSTKIQKIIKDLVPSMPNQKRLFWEKIAICETSTDLLNNRD